MRGIRSLGSGAGSSEEGERLAAPARMLASRAWRSGEARERLRVSWYRLKWRGRFLLQGGCFVEEFPAMLRSADSQYAGEGSS